MRITNLNKRRLYGSVIKDFPVALTTGTPRERIGEKQTNNETIKQTNKQKNRQRKKSFPARTCGKVETQAISWDPVLQLECLQRKTNKLVARLAVYYHPKLSYNRSHTCS